jgi:hypothetical protein
MPVMGEHINVQLGQCGPGMDVSTALRCMPLHLDDHKPRWLLLPTLGEVCVVELSFCCRYDRRKRYKEKDWHVKHYEFIQLWETRQQLLVDADPPHDQHTFDEYL